MMLNGIAFPEVPESLIMPGFEIQAKAGGSGVDLLPDSAPFVHVTTYQKQIFAKQL
jgi:nitrite reductase (NADH) large subunit